MVLNRFPTYFVRLLAAWLAVAGLMASEHHGFVKSGGLPVPGATVTATKGDERHVTTTDEDGKYAFADLKDGVWKIEVDMLGFAKISNEVGIAFDSPAPQWDLKFLTLSAITAPPTPAPTPAAGLPRLSLSSRPRLPTNRPPPPPRPLLPPRAIMPAREEMETATPRRAVADAARTAPATDAPA